MSTFPVLLAVASMLASPAVDLVPPPVTPPPVTAPPAGTPVAAPDPGAGTAPVVPADDPARAILKRARDASQSFDRFRANLLYAVEDDIEGRITSRLGRVLHERRSPEAGGPRLAVAFTRRIDDGRQLDIDRHYTVAGRWFIEVDRKERLFIKRSVAPEGQTFDPFTLGEGSFPLPIGQDPDEVLRSFTATPIDRPTDGPLASRLPRTGLAGLRLDVKPDVPLYDEMESMRVWYDAASGIPLGVVVVRWAKTETVVLQQLEIDPDFTPDDLLRLSQVEPVAPGWRVQTR